MKGLSWQGGQPSNGPFITTHMHLRLLILGFKQDPFGLLGTPDSIEEFEKLEAELSDKNGRLWFPFFKGTFEDVKREFASRSDPDTILVIYLHSNSEKGDEIGKQILASREASANYDEPTLICWMANAGANYQYERLARKLGYSGAYPAFLFFSDFKGKLKLEKAISGTEISLSSLNNELNEVKSLLTIRSLSEETNAKSESQILRADQDAAYQMSLAADRQKREEALRKQKEEEMEIERKMALEAELKAEEQERAKRLEKLKENLVPESQEGIIISTQLLDGRRVNHRFALASNIQDVYDFYAVESEMLPEEFQLRVPIPPSILPRGKETLQAAGILTNTKLILEDLRK